MSRWLLSWAFLAIASGAKPPLADAQPVRVQVRALFQEAIEDPLAREVFNEIQFTRLNSPPDQNLRDFFKNDPVLGTVYQEFAARQDALLAEFDLMGKVHLLKIKPSLTPVYDRIDKALVDVATQMGFAQEAIDHREFYLESSSSPNAFTVSSSPTRIIVVINSELVEKMTVSEVRGVLAHELGHIRSKHTLLSNMHNLMANLLVFTFVNPPVPISELAEGSLGPGVYKALKEHDIGFCLMACVHGRDFSHSADESGLDPVEGKALFGRTLRAIWALPRVEVFGLIERYLKALLPNMGQVDVAVETLSFYGHLLNDIQYSLTEIQAGITNARPNPTTLDRMIPHLARSLNSMVRSSEISADRYAIAYDTKAAIASALLKLMGAKFRPEERAGLLEVVLKQAKDFQDSRASAKVGMLDGSHPPLALRIQSIIDAPLLPFYFFARDLTRTLFLENELNNQTIGLAQSLSKAEKVEDRQVIHTAMAASKTSLKRLRTLIVTALAKEKLGAVRPILAELAQFYVTVRTTRLQTLEIVNKAIESRPEAERAPFIGLRDEMLARLNRPAPLLKGIRSLIKREAAVNEQTRNLVERAFDLAETSQSVDELNRIQEPLAAMIDARTASCQSLLAP